MSQHKLTGSQLKEKNKLYGSTYIEHRQGGY